jgi:hypothetical protein
MEKPINISKYEEKVYEEKLLKNEQDSLNRGKTYHIEIISKRTKAFKSYMNFNFNNRQVIVKTSEDLEIFINFADILGFITEKTMNEKKANDIKLEIGTKSKNVDFFKNKIFAQVYFNPKYTIKSCLCCGWICCKCSETKTIRKQKVNLEI